MIPNMNSIFATEEDFEFSDDDSLNLSLFNKPIEEEKSQKEEKHEKRCLSSEPASQRSPDESSKITYNGRTGPIRHDHMKNYSMFRSRLKERSNCGNFESNELEAQCSSISYNSESKRNLHRGFKFHFNPEGHRQHFLDSISSFKNDYPLKPVKAEMENILSFEHIMNVNKDKYEDKVETETNKFASSGFVNEAKQMEKKHRLFVDDRPLKRNFDFTEDNPSMQVFSKKQQNTAEINIADDELIDKYSKEDANTMQNSPQDAQSTMISKKRKFPGPAGLLPKLDPTQNIDHISTPISRISKRRIKKPKSITTTKMIEKEESDFHRSFWSRLQRQALQKYKGLVYHSISLTLKKACSNQLEKGKVPLMCVLIKTFTLNGSDASVILKDPTGEINGTIHKGVLESCQTGLCPGSGMILRHVSIFSPSSRKHYVNITPSNIMLLQQEDASLSPSFKVMQNTGNEADSMLTGSAMANAENQSKPITVEEGQQEEDDIDALLADDEDFDSWFGDSEDFLAEVSEEQFY